MELTVGSIPGLIMTSLPSLIFEALVSVLNSHPTSWSFSGQGGPPNPQRNSGGQTLVWWGYGSVVGLLFTPSYRNL